MERKAEWMRDLQLKAESRVAENLETGLFSKEIPKKTQADRRSAYVRTQADRRSTYVRTQADRRSTYVRTQADRRSTYVRTQADQRSTYVRTQADQRSTYVRTQADQRSTYVRTQADQRSAYVKKQADRKSIYVGNVDYEATAEELESFFLCCGKIKRVTIICDRLSGYPKGYAYIEFEEKSSMKTAMTLNRILFRGRMIKVLPKRTNLPGVNTTEYGGYYSYLQGCKRLAQWGSGCGKQDTSA